jgi:hypothetical protein
VYRTSLGAHRLLVSAEIDCEESLADGSRSFVEIKTSGSMQTAESRCNFRERKLIKYWIQSYVAGVPAVVVGYRSEDGVLTVRPPPLPSSPLLSPLLSPRHCCRFRAVEALRCTGVLLCNCCTAWHCIARCCCGCASLHCASGHRPLQHFGNPDLRAVGYMGLQPVPAVCQRFVRLHPAQHGCRHALHACLQQRSGEVQPAALPSFF